MKLHPKNVTGCTREMEVYIYYVSDKSCPLFNIVEKIGYNIKPIQRKKINLLESVKHIFETSFRTYFEVRNSKKTIPSKFSMHCSEVNYTKL